MYLTVFVCMLAGSPCKALPLPPEMADFRFEDGQQCTAIGVDLMKLWLQTHREWQDGGVTCRADKSK